MMPPAALLQSRGIDPEEMLQYVAPWVYFIVALAYNGLVFRNEFSPKSTSAFSEGNPVFRILAVDTCFLVIVLCLIRVASFVVVHLPRWMTNTLKLEAERTCPPSLLTYVWCWC